MDVKRRSSILDFRKILVDTFVKAGIIHLDFTGEITISITAGGIAWIRKSETFK